MAKKKAKGGIQLPFPALLPKSKWRAPTETEGAISWPKWGSVAIDIETRDDDLKALGCGARRGGYIAGIAYAIDGGPANYLPLRHELGGNCSWDAMQYIRDQFKEFAGELVVAGGQYDLDFLMEAGVPFDRHRHIVFDVQVAEPLIDELQFRYNLDAIAERRGLPGKDESLLRAAAAEYGIDPKKEMWKMPAEFVGPYAVRDVTLPFELRDMQLEDIRKQDLKRVFELESATLPILMEMRRRGVRIDTDQLQRMEDWATDQQQKALDEIKVRTGVEIPEKDLNKPNLKARALEFIGITLPRTPKTNQPQILAPFLESLDHPVPRALRRALQMDKLKRTYVGGVRKHMVNGRIHCTFNQLRRQKDDGKGTEGAAYGRLSATHPNLQNQPVRNEEYGSRWRSIYIPDDGKQWAVCDFSQQEPRLTVHFAEACELPGAERAAEQYHNDPNADNHQMMADMANIKRKAAKEIFLGLCYNMGGARLCHKLGLPTEWKMIRGERREVAGPEGQRLLNTFNKKVPFVKMLAKLAEKKAKERGYIRTLSGRRCRFPLDARGEYDWCSKAMNRLIQGSAADQTKWSMIAVTDAGFELQLQVHDEVDFSFSHPDEPKQVAAIMEETTKLRVPNKVDVETGPNWGEVK